MALGRAWKRERNSAVVEEFIQGPHSPGGDIGFRNGPHGVQAPAGRVRLDLLVPQCGIALDEPGSQASRLGTRQTQHRCLDLLNRYGLGLKGLHTPDFTREDMPRQGLVK